MVPYVNRKSTFFLLPYVAKHILTLFVDSDFQEVQCAPLSAPTYATMTGTGNEYGDTVQFTCLAGHTLTAGDTDRTCQADGMWSGLQPSCTGIDTT